jgi:hypothetical protein
MVFRLARTYDDPSADTSAQRGFPAPGAGGQTTGDYHPAPAKAQNRSGRPVKGTRSFPYPFLPADRQRGFPSPQNALEARPAGSMPNAPPIFGGVYQNYTPYYSRGAAAFVPNFGRVLTNPIGAGIYAPYRTQASYGPPAHYANGAIWWTSQAIPTSVHLAGLTDPDILAQLVGMTNVQAMVRTTG